MKCYLFDLDGTLCDLTHRLHLIKVGPGETADWDAFFDACCDDSPITHMLTLANMLAVETDVIFVSGRAERCRDATMVWLKKYLPDLNWSDSERELYMRADGDHRADRVVKLELLSKIREDGYEPIMAFEDRDQVVKMWRAAGIPCAQVAEGNF